MAINQQQSDGKVGRANRRTSGKLFVVAILMFGFGYALIPLYEVICDITGLNGKTQKGEVQAVASLKVDKTRTITVEFTGHASSDLPWEFRPEKIEMKVHPGEVLIANYIARNLASESITGRATPSVAPSKAAKHFKKLECFCFTEQTLAAGETKKMPVRFYVDPKVPKEVSRVTLSYAFYNRHKASANKYRKSAASHASMSVQ